MSLDVSLAQEVYTSNITHNLAPMAEAAGIYQCLWHPTVYGAHELIEPLTAGLKKLIDNPAKFKKLESPNAWGTYIDFIAFVSAYLEACKQNPNATVHASI